MALSDFVSTVGIIVSEAHSASTFSPNDSYSSFSERQPVSHSPSSLIPTLHRLSVAGWEGDAVGWLHLAMPEITPGTVASASAESIHHHYCNETQLGFKPCNLYILMSRNPKK